MGKMEITWPPDYIELKIIEDLLICGICYEYMDVPVMTPCSHNYCSLCIRKYLHYKPQCPACFEDTFEKDLHANRILHKMIECYLTLREKLVLCIKGAVVRVTRTKEANTPPPVRPPRSNQILRTPRKVEKEMNGHSEETNARSNGLFKGTPQKPQNLKSSPSTSVRVPQMFSPRSRKDAIVEDNGKKVECPVCKVDISEAHINKHLDDCLKRDSNPSQTNFRVEPKRKTLPKLVLNLMKESELRKTMKSHGLSTQGDRKTLEARFQRYSTLYNAECDKTNPRPVAELIKQCEEEETLEKKMRKVFPVGSRYEVSRRADQNAIEEAQRKYLEVNKSNYQSLIDDIRSRNEAKRSSARRSILEQQNGDCSEERHSRLIPGENDDNFEQNDFAPLDSDSSTSCPLQWYSSDDPMNYLAVELNDESKKSASLSKERSEQTESPDRIEDRPSISRDSPNQFVIPASPESPDETAQEVDYFVVTTDSESTNSEGAFASAKKEKKHINKRVKLCPSDGVDDSESFSSQSPECDSVKLRQTREREAREFAMSIIKDFSFDDDFNNALEESQNSAASEQMSRSGTLGISRMDKENADSSVDKKLFVCRPSRKKSRASRVSDDNGIVELAEKGRPAKKILDEQTENRCAREIETEAATHTDITKASGIDSESTLKRRRGRPKKVPSPANTVVTPTKRIARMPNTKAV